MDSIDKLLAEIKTEYEQPAKSKQHEAKPPLAESFNQLPPKTASLIDNLLAEVQADFAERDAAEELQRQQELQKERIRQEQLKKQQIEALKKTAQDWLDKLDAFSSEGLWFERFAETYPSKLEAAIEYLQFNK